MTDTTSGGRLYFNIVASIAEFEREPITERTQDGLAPLVRADRRGGRRPALSNMQKVEARRMYESRKYTVQQITDALRCSPATIYRSVAPASPTA
jgi:DNA invertase Pin-like site-specific DNA recombinase